MNSFKAPPITEGCESHKLSSKSRICDATLYCCVGVRMADNRTAKHTHTFNMELISKQLVQERLMARFVTGFEVLVELTNITCVCYIVREGRVVTYSFREDARTGKPRWV